MSKLLLFFFFLVFYSVVSSFSGSEFITSGYNIYLGNPNPTDSIYDQGFFLHPIFKLNYRQNKTLSSNSSINIPDEIDVIPINSCSFNTEENEYYGETSYYNFLKISVSMEASYIGFYTTGSFSASADYQRKSKEFSSEKIVQFNSEAKCIERSTKIRDNEPLELTIDFKKAILKLISPEDFYSFFDYYGTDYLTKITFGSKNSIESTFQKEVIDQWRADGFQISLAARASYLFAKGSYSASTTLENEMARNFDNSRISIHEITIGSRPSNNGDQIKWARETGSNPVPINIEIESFSKLLKKTNFQDIPHEFLVNLAKRLDFYRFEYCKSKAGDYCYGPKPDLSLGNYVIMSRQSIGEFNLKCPDGNVVTAVAFQRVEVGGYDNLPQWSTSNNFQEVVCKDDFGAVCYAICNSILKESDLQYLILSDWYCPSENAAKCPRYLTCPTGYVILSCGIGLFGKYESNPSISIISENTCKCYSYFSEFCSGICVKKNLVEKSYEIIGGVNEAKCTGNKYLLGCTMADNQKNSFSMIPTAHSCKCPGFACQAVCADIYDLKTLNLYKCLPNKISEFGCEECIETHYLSKGICIEKPCFNKCPNCLTHKQCLICQKCTQCKTFGCKTCTNSKLLHFGCRPCAKFNYLHPNGHCTPCLNHDMYPSEINDGTGKCLKCSRLYQNCKFCNGITHNCKMCEDNFYFDSDFNCVKCSNHGEIRIVDSQNIKRCVKCQKKFPNCEYCDENKCLKFHKNASCACVLMEKNFNYYILIFFIYLLIN